ncbi:MAG: PCMD domain-containing protein [Fibromonadales bacterium]|nr:PCMD domain-containing protein [Fibromonadales bacterium]
MKKFIMILVCAGVFCSCSSDSEVKSSENYIEEFKVANISAEIRNDLNQIYIFVFPENYESILAAQPSNIKCSENATLTNSGGNWTDKDFLYTVTAENGEQRSYRVYIDIARRKYSFESWGITNGYYSPSDSNSSWSSGNPGIKMALQILERDAENPKSYPTRDTTDIYGGAVLLETLEGGNVFGREVYLFSGNFFLGNFNVSKAISDELAATEVGRMYTAKPKSIKGYYKYKEGPGVFMSKGVPEPGRNDSCNIYAHFYRSESNITLSVKDIDKSNLVIATGRLPNCSETEGDEFQPFELTLNNYKSEPDFANHSYKLAIVFSASKNGDVFAGKIGSKLIIDEIEITDY